MKVWIILQSTNLLHMKKIEDGDDDKKFRKVLDPCHFAG